MPWATAVARLPASMTSARRRAGRARAPRSGRRRPPRRRCSPMCAVQGGRDTATMCGKTRSPCRQTVRARNPWTSTSSAAARATGRAGLTLAAGRRAGQHRHLDAEPAEAGKRRLALDHLPRSPRRGREPDELLGSRRRGPARPAEPVQPGRDDDVAADRPRAGRRPARVQDHGPVARSAGTRRTELPVHEGHDWIYVLSGRPAARSWATRTS